MPAALERLGRSLFVNALGAMVCPRLQAYQMQPEGSVWRIEVCYSFVRNAKKFQRLVKCL